MNKQNNDLLIELVTEKMMKRLDSAFHWGVVAGFVMGIIFTYWLMS